jgi:hypothetical protein
MSMKHTPAQMKRLIAAGRGQPAEFTWGVSYRHGGQYDRIEVKARGASAAGVAAMEIINQLHPSQTPIYIVSIWMVK